MENFKYLLKGNLINNCPVTHHDVDNMIQIWGKDIAAIKGKTARRTPRKVIEETFDVPRELKEKGADINLCVDIMYVEDEIFLTGIGLPIRFRSVTPLKSEKTDEIYRGIDMFFRTYNKNGFKIKKLQCDGQFKPLFEKVEDELGVEMNYTNAQDYVPGVE